MKNQENTIFFINHNKNINALREIGGHWSLLLYVKNENKLFHHDPIANKNKDYAVMMATKIKISIIKSTQLYLKFRAPNKTTGMTAAFTHSILYIKKIVHKNPKRNIS